MPKRQPWGFVIQDDDSKQYAFTGIITDDRGWNDRVSEAQKQGRKLSCFSHTAANVTQLTDWAKQNGLTCVSVETILARPVDRSPIYEGVLPAYAGKANRRRVVKVLCRGKCQGNTWAEMNTDYPGQPNLESAAVGAYTAKCLVCGHVAKDPYNWTR